MSSSCEVKLPNSLRFPNEATTPIGVGGGPASVIADGGGLSILLPAAALLLGSVILTYAILSRG